MQEVIQVLAYTTIKDECPECGGKGKITDWRYTSSHCEKACKSCGGSGKVNKNVSEFRTSSDSKEDFTIWAVVKRFETVTETDINKWKAGNYLGGGASIRKELSLKAGDKRSFSLSTGECKDCEAKTKDYRDWCDNARKYIASNPDTKCARFMPKVIEAEVLKKFDFDRLENGLYYIGSFGNEVRELMSSVEVGEYLLVELKILKD